MPDPWYKTTFLLSVFGVSLKIRVPHDAFSTQRIDEGTLLLLDHLPGSTPGTVLDMGCGYGALGLPIAAKFPHAQIEMVDRDLLAVDWSNRNALENALPNIDVHGSLGFGDVKQKQYDWILCNVPARIGTPFIQNFMEVGSKLLSPTGELRVVVINDLGPVLKTLQAAAGWPLTEIAIGPRHSIFSMKHWPNDSTPIPPETLYLRDEVTVHDLILARPFDIGGDDQKRLKTSLPILIDALPRQALTASQKVLCFRSGYGALPLIARKRWPEAQIIAVDRDLLGTTYTHYNAKKLELDGEKLEVREFAHFPGAIQSEERFDLILGELSSSAGDAVALAETGAVQKSLKPGGQALILCLDKMVKALGPGPSKILTREGYSVLRITP